MARIRIYAHLGGVASAYRPRLKGSCGDHHLDPADLPGLGGRHREAPSDDLGRVARAEALRLAGGVENLVLYGHSLGALMAFEVARRLQAVGTPARGLVVSGRNAPGSVAGTPPRTDPEILEFLRRVGGTPETVLADPDMSAYFLPGLRAGFGMIETYRPDPDPVLACPTLVLGGRDDAMVDEAGLRAWQAWVAPPIRVMRPPGGHLFPLRDDAGWTSGLWDFVAAVSSA